jgi:hypothetical protein
MQSTSLCSSNSGRHPLVPGDSTTLTTGESAEEVRRGASRGTRVYQTHLRGGDVFSDSYCLMT